MNFHSPWENLLEVTAIAYGEAKALLEKARRV